MERDFGLNAAATFIPSVNGAIQTKYYYCEVTSDCDGSTVVKSDIVTVNVVGSITYYTVTLVPAGGTCASYTGWTYDNVNDKYTKEVSDGSELTLPTFTKTNRTFKTWRKSGPTDVASPITVTADVTLTAVWTATIENVIYSWEGGSPATETGGTAVTKAQDGTDAASSDINVDAVGGFYDGYATFQKNGKYGKIDTLGTVVIMPTFDHLYRTTDNGLSIFEKNKKQGLQSLQMMVHIMTSKLQKMFLFRTRRHLLFRQASIHLR